MRDEFAIRRAKNEYDAGVAAARAKYELAVRRAKEDYEIDLANAQAKLDFDMWWIDNPNDDPR